MLQQDNADDYVLATGESHTVREFIEIAFLEINVIIEQIKELLIFSSLYFIGNTTFG